MSAALDWAPRCRVTTDKAVRRYVNNDIRMMNIEREFLAADDEFLCIEPELRQQYFARHLADELTDDERAAFADHLLFCRKCETDAAYFAWSARLLCAAALGFALLGGMPRGARAAAFLGPGYLLAKEFRQK